MQNDNNSNRLLSKLAPVRKVGEGSARRTAVYTPVHEDSSTEPTNKFSTGVEFEKKSNVNNAFNFTIYTDDTDCFGMVYHSNFIKYMARARTHYLASQGVDLAKLHQQEDCIFPVHHVNVEFMQPARLGDKLTIFSRMLKIGKVSVNFEHKIVKQDAQSGQGNRI